MKKYAIIYRRVSSEEKRNRQHIERQDHPTKEFCRKKGFEILEDGKFVDWISGAIEPYKRKGYKKLLDYIENNKEKFEKLQLNVVFDEVTRLGRKQLDILDQIDKFSKQYVNIHIVNPEITYLDENGNVNETAFNIVSSMAQYAEAEYRRLKYRIKSSIHRTLEQNHSLGGVELYSYKKEEDKKIIEIEKEESKIVKKIFKMYLNGIGTTSIANYLNAEGVPTRKGKKWNTSTIVEMLRNKQYIGIRELYKNNKERKTQIFEAKHLQIIDDKTFEKVQDILNSKKQYQTKKKKYLNPFSGLFYCNCNSPIYVKYNKTNKKLAYICSSNNNNNQKCNYFTQIDYNKLNNIIHTLYDEIISLTNTQQNIIDNLKNEKNDLLNINIKTLQSELNNFNEQRERANKRYIKGKISEKLLDDTLDEINKEEVNKRDKLKQYQTRVKEIDSQIEKLNNTDNTSIIDVNQLKVFAENNIKNITIQRINNLKGFEDLFRSNETIYKIDITLIIDKIITVFTGNYTKYLITTPSGITLESNQFKKGFIKHIDDKEDVELYHRIINDNMYLILEINKFFEKK